mmetsp:Transcript_21/g.74  ORF Transcript_21/g.74 Transcript_21/m.74 type:complete len:81 (+) Transcript_21:682-924(+)
MGANAERFLGPFDADKATVQHLAARSMLQGDRMHLHVEIPDSVTKEGLSRTHSVNLLENLVKAQVEVFDELQKHSLVRRC